MQLLTNLSAHIRWQRTVVPDKFEIDVRPNPTVKVTAYGNDSRLLEQSRDDSSAVSARDPRLFTGVNDIRPELPSFRAHQHSPRIDPGEFLAVDHDDCQMSIRRLVPFDATAHIAVDDPRSRKSMCLTDSARRTFSAMGAPN
jgi:hypothetical protein